MVDYLDGVVLPESVTEIITKAVEPWGEMDFQRTCTTPPPTRVNLLYTWHSSEKANLWPEVRIVVIPKGSNTSGVVLSYFTAKPRYLQPSWHLG